MNIRFDALGVSFAEPEDPTRIPAFTPWNRPLYRSLTWHTREVAWKTTPPPVIEDVSSWFYNLVHLLTRI